jgi:hypothetical protein
MSAVLEADTVEAGSPTESQLLDVLYEVLAQGVPAKGSLTTEQVERFLHEHARSKKSVEEMLEFFGKHELPTDASAYGCDPELAELASGLHRDRPPITANFNLAEELEGPERSASDSGPMRKVEASAALVEGRPWTPGQVVETPWAGEQMVAGRAWAREQVVEVEVEADDATQRGLVPAVVPVSSPPTWVLPVACGICVAFAAALLGTYRHAHDMKLQLDSARLQQRSTDAALGALERRSETLRGALADSESQRKALASRFDEFVAGATQKHAAEEAALQRLLGTRFQTLRDRALQESAAP